MTPARVSITPRPHDSSAPEQYHNINVDSHPERAVRATDRIAGERLGTINASAGGLDLGSRPAVATGDTATETNKSKRDERTNLGSLPEQVKHIGSPNLRTLPPAQVAGVVPHKTSTTRKGWKGFVRALGPVANMFGPVKDVTEMLVECLDKCEIAGEAKIEYDVLRVRLEGLLGDLQGQFGEECSLTMTSSMEALCESIRAELNHIKQKLNRSAGGRYVGALGEEDEVLSCYRRIEASVQRLSLNANLSMWKIVHEDAAGSRLNRMSSRVERLPFSPPAWYNSAEGINLKRRGCTPDTRVGVLATVLGWARSEGEGAVYWLNGMAGTGKTTIAYTVCAELDATHQLGASFFCSRLREECRNVNLIIPSIAYQLSRFSLPFRSALSLVLEEDPDVHERLPEMQFQALIAKPLLEVEHTLPDGLVVVIDALDECENPESTSRMLDIILSKASSLPIKFIVSSRPEPEIREEMTTDRTKSRLVLHELDKGEVQTDIETYLRTELAPMNPEEAHIKALAEQARILFIYAATAVRYIGYGNFRRNPRSRLRTILGVSHTPGTTEHDEIDQLYTTVLKAALGDSRLEPEEREDMRQVLHTVICAREPLTVAVISELLQIKDVERVQAALQPLWSVLHVVESNEMVTTLHASFLDFMFNPTRSQAYHCDSESHNLKLSELCFKCVQRTQPQFNICGLESSYIFDKSVPNIEDRVTQSISPVVFYSCRYWADHIMVASRESSLIEQLHDFLSVRLLLWMEVMNLKKQLMAGTQCMKLAVEWCKAMKVERALTELAQDAKRFVETFASNPVSESTPHIYVSVLAFWPRTLPIAKYYAKYTCGPVQVEGTALDQRQLAHLSTWEFGKPAHALVVSPDGLCLALGVGKDVIVVDSSGGKQRLGPLTGHPDTIVSITFSPDGACLIAGSLESLVEDPEATILGWDIRSGDVVLGPLRLQGHILDINHLSFSSDCTLIATGSEDNTVRLWDTVTGTTRHCLATKSRVYSTGFSPDGTQLAAGTDYSLQVWDTRTGHITLGPLYCENALCSVAFSPDNLHIISAGWHDAALHVWNSQSGEMILGPIEGHTSGITCINYSPDSRFVVSGSADRTVRVWDAQNGNLVLGPLESHTAEITSVAFTPDGSRIVSACLSKLVCTWDVQARKFTSSPTNPPLHRITCVKFSSDGTRFASGSEEGTISIWDVHTWEARVAHIEAHANRINAVDFWNDCVVSGAADGTICVWDTLTEEIALGPIRLGIGVILRLAYSPKAQMIVTGSDHGAHVWNARNGNRVLGPLTGLSGWGKSVQFSPDGTRIVGCSFVSGNSKNILIWEVPTGKILFGGLDGHHSGARSVSYSPDGALIASGSDDTTIIIWDAYTGEKRLGPLIGHSDWVLSVHFSPDSTRLVSGSRDRTIRIWDVQTGEMVYELPSGHWRTITSVEYSPDGTRILSRSDDMSARIHDARSPAERALSSSESEVGDWKINKDGWVVDNRSRLLVWVPGDLRKALMRSETRLVIAPHGYVRLKFDKSRMGESWAKGFTSGV